MKINEIYENKFLIEIELLARILNIFYEKYIKFRPIEI